ncbi:MAG TPA: YlbE-like family protein [Chondromyces sp.]|nr:YlbE-like family protein [Chondromyces sp.]
MRQDIMQAIRSNKEWLDFLRQNPKWYRLLGRNPDALDQFDIAALHYYQKTIGHRLEKFQQGMQVTSMMINMFQFMKQNEQPANKGKEQTDEAEIPKSE